MPDEITALRWFRDSTPGPDDAAWQRARSAIAEAAAPSFSPPARPAPRRWRVSGRTVIIGAALATVAAVVAAFLVIAGPGPAVTPHGPAAAGQALGTPRSSTWQAARPLPAAGGGSATVQPTGTWRLTSDLIQQGWQENTAGPVPGALTCPTASTCYVVGVAAPGMDLSDLTSFYVTTDGTQTWSTLPVPSGVVLTSPLSCTSAASCAAGGLYHDSQPVYLATTNGGHSWTIRSLPASVGQVSRLDCAAGTCQGLSGPVTPFAGKPKFTSTIPVSRFVTITAGGVTVSTFAAGDVMDSVSCPTATECVATGAAKKIGPLWVPGSHDFPSTSDVVGVLPNHHFLLATSLVLTTRDGGQTWQPGKLPAAPGLSFSQVTCADASQCRMLGYGDTSSSDSGSAVAFSGDGGATWTVSDFPASIPHSLMNSLACPTATTCYAAGMSSIPSTPGPLYIGSPYDNISSAVIAVTTDAGRSWQRISFRVPRSVGDPFPVIGSIQCPQQGTCVALGVGAEGKSTPVYTNDSAG
jgi:photosystem II stability/assembly factor-like uncharacterized protein